jgi:hypothetical protein
MKPDEYRKYEVSTIRSSKDIIISGLGITLIDKSMFNNIKTKGLVGTPITIYNSIKDIYEPNKIILFCQVIVKNKKDADIHDSNTIVVFNEKCIVIVGYLHEYTYNSYTRWNPINSVINAYKYFDNKNIILAFHGTNLSNSKSIKKDGFRSFRNLKDTNTAANYFTPYIWYAYNWAHFEGSPGVIFVCLISLKNPMPEKTYKSIYDANNREESTAKLLEKVADKKYDGAHLGDEIWVWNPKSVIIVGKIKYF